MKFLILAILALVVFRMVFHKWPWEMFRESEKSQQRAQARALLGVDRNASREDILAAHRLILTAHPDKGGSPEEVFRIDAARDILLEQTVPTKR